MPSSKTSGNSLRRMLLTLYGGTGKIKTNNSSSTMFSQEGKNNSNKKNTSFTLGTIINISSLLTIFKIIKIKSSVQLVIVMDSSSRKYQSD